MTKFEVSIRDLSVISCLIGLFNICWSLAVLFLKSLEVLVCKKFNDSLSLHIRFLLRLRYDII